MSLVAARRALGAHWPEYLMEAAELGLFMVSAGVFAIVLEYPGSPLRQAIPDATARRALMGLAMGGTAIGIVYSPIGKQSGAHFNPAVTLAFLRLGKVAPWDAAFYVAAQFIGASLAVLAVAAAVGGPFADPGVNHVATLPGEPGVAVAFVAEVLISLVLMLVILVATNTHRLAHYTGMLAGVLVAFYIAVESPLSGMSMNPARSFGPALEAGLWHALWVYLLAPPLGMLGATEAYRLLRGTREVKCAKLHHQNDRRCIFRCGYAADGAPPRGALAVPVPAGEAR